MSCLEIRKVTGGGRLCETCLVEQGPNRSGVFAVYLLGYPADKVCNVHAKKWRQLFESAEEKAA